MGNALATRAEFNTAAKAPNLTASQRRLLADPFSLGGEVVAWEPPGGADWVRANRERILAVKGELERSLMAPTPSHMQWCVRKLFSLPSKNGTELDKALQADNYLDVCGHFPDDLWSWGTSELLKTKTFRPSPSEMVALVEPKHGERQRMLERVKQMLGGAPKPALPAPAEPTTRLERLRITRALYEKHNRPLDVERIDREIAAEQGQALPGQRRDNVEQPARAEPYRPADTPTNRRLAELAKTHRQPAATLNQPVEGG